MGKKSPRKSRSLHGASREAGASKTFRVKTDAGRFEWPCVETSIEGIVTHTWDVIGLWRLAHEKSGYRIGNFSFDSLELAQDIVHSVSEKHHFEFWRRKRPSDAQVKRLIAAINDESLFIFSPGAE